MDFSILDRYITEDIYGKYNIPGCTIVIKKGYKTVFKKTYGLSDIETKTPLTGNEQYRLYSCTKPVTVAGAMRLVESGMLELDAPASRYLPFFDEVYLMKDGQRLSPSRSITVRNLFTMTAGFDYSTECNTFNKLFDNGGARVSVTDFARAAVSRPLANDVGERYRYSICHDLLGALIESVSGLGFGEYQKKYIFEPLGMTKTGFFTTLDQEPVFSEQYVVNAETKAVEKDPNVYVHGLRRNYESGGAGLISTAEDYSKFASAMACGGVAENGYRLLSKKTIDLMRSEQLHSFAVSDSFGTCAAGPGYGYGLGVRTLVSKEQGQRSPLGEFGWDGAAGAYVLMDVDNAVSISFVTALRKWPSLLGTHHAPIRDLTYECLEL